MKFIEIYLMKLLWFTNTLFCGVRHVTTVPLEFNSMLTLGIARKISMNSASSPYTSLIVLRIIIIIIQFVRLVKLKTNEILTSFKNAAMMQCFITILNLYI